MTKCVESAPFDLMRGYDFRIFPHLTAHAKHEPGQVPCSIYRKSSPNLFGKSPRLGEWGCFGTPLGEWTTLSLVVERTGASEFKTSMEMNGVKYEARDAVHPSDPTAISRVDAVAIGYPNGRHYTYVDLGAVAVASSSPARQPVEQWGQWEGSWAGPSSGNPFVDTTLKVSFALTTATDVVSQSPFEVRGFYDGNGQYKARFMPPTVGTWRYTTASNVPAMHGKVGTFVVVRAHRDAHGPVTVSKKNRKCQGRTKPCTHATACTRTWNLVQPAFCCTVRRE